MAEVTDCSICLERFVEPKMLPCQHTYCLRCLRSLNINRTIKCPECRTSHPVSINGVGDFPNNLAIVRFLSALQPSSSAKNMPCRDCKSGRNIQKLCEHCDRYLCEVCIKDHIQLMTDVMSIDMAELKDLNSTIKEELEEITRREEKAKPLETEIKEWEEKCIEEVRSKAERLIAAVHSRLNIDQSLTEEAQHITNEIEWFDVNFARLKMSEMLQQKERLKKLTERSKSLSSTISSKPQGTMPRLKFDSQKAENAMLAIRRVEGVRKMTQDELTAEKQLTALIPQRKSYEESLQHKTSTQPIHEVKEIIKKYDIAIQSCEAGIPIDMNGLQSYIRFGESPKIFSMLFRR